MAPAPSPAPVVIVGAGVAGTACALHLHELCPAQSITLVDPRPSLTVARALTRVGDRPLDVAVDSADARAWCAARNIRFVRARATRLTPGTLHVRRARADERERGGESQREEEEEEENEIEEEVEDEECIHFAALCVASGARPAVPPSLVPAVAARRALVVRDARSVAALRAALATARHAVVVGAGGIGMEVVHEACCRVTWFARRGAVGAAFLDDAVVAWLRGDGGRGKSAGQTETETQTQTETDQRTVIDLARSHASCNGDAPERNVAAPAATTPAAAVGPAWLGARADGVLLPDSPAGPVKKRLPGLCGDSDSDRPARVESERRVVDVEDAGTGSEYRLHAVLSDGCRLPCDVVVVATGVRANTEWLRGSGVALADDTDTDTDTDTVHGDGAGGVVVQAGAMHSSVPGVFAAGDCTSAAGADADCDWVQARTWGQALSGGRAAAAAMGEFACGSTTASGGLEFEVFAHATRFFGERVVLLGRWRAQGLCAGYSVVEQGTRTAFARAVLLDGRVRGAVLAGDVARAEAFENLIAGRLDVSWLGSRLVDEEFELEDYFD